MVWGAFCGSLKSPLYIVPPGTTINSARYTTNVLEPLLIPLWHEACEEYGWARVVEDNAPGHKKFATASRIRHGVDSIDWPPQSPDLNLIEALWADMETELGQIHEWAEDVDSLVLMLQAAWDSITPERLSRLIASMPRRLAAVIAAGGNATKY